jgi:hypothetical protein
VIARPGGCRRERRPTLDRLDHRPEVLQWRIELHMVGRPQDQAAVAADRAQPGPDLLADIVGRAEGQGVLLVGQRSGSSWESAAATRSR